MLARAIWALTEASHGLRNPHILIDGDVNVHLVAAIKYRVDAYHVTSLTLALVAVLLDNSIVAPQYSGRSRI